ncbi:MAG TPA: hypothetical protein VGD33_11125 [Chitinophagaceae bacterium]
MKQIFIFAAMLFISVTTYSQSEKYTQTMEANVAIMDSARSVETLQDLSNLFERVANAEKNQWLPFYYAALAKVNAGYIMTNGQMGGMAEKLDPVADKAEELLVKAEELSKNNSEIFIVKKMIATLRMMGDPMTRYMQYGPEAAEALATAKQLNPENPRVYYLEGQDKFYTPEQFGGSKAEAVKLFQVAVDKFNSFKPESSIHPHWGKAATEYYLIQAKK